MAKKVNNAIPPDIPENRDGAGRFRPGSSGNPKGRPKLPKEVKEMFKAATADAAQLLIDTMNDPDADLKLRIDCAEKVIERVYGKPPQPIDGNVDGTLVIELAGEIRDYAG